MELNHHGLLTWQLTYRWSNRTLSEELPQLFQYLLDIRMQPSTVVVRLAGYYTLFHDQSDPCKIQGGKPQPFTIPQRPSAQTVGLREYPLPILRRLLVCMEPGTTRQSSPTCVTLAGALV